MLSLDHEYYFPRIHFPGLIYQWTVCKKKESSVLLRGWHQKQLIVAAPEKTDAS